MWPRYLCFNLLQMRIRLIQDILSKKRTMQEVSSLLQVSRQSISKWLARYRIEGEAGLIPKKSWPKNSIPFNKTHSDIEEKIGDIARIFPELWPQAIADKLEEQTGIILNQSTIYRILRRTGVRYKKKGEWRQRRKKLYAHDTPWREIQLDVCFPFWRKRREVQYDALDDCSRFVVSKVHTEHCVRSSMEFIENLIHEAPFRIKRIKTDCGMEFWPGFTAFLKSRWIEHVRTAPYSPQHNGKVERYHRTLWQHMWDYSTQIDIHEYRLNLKLFTDWYNSKKPHHWLWMFGMTPKQKIGYCLLQHSLTKTRECCNTFPLMSRGFADVNLTLQFNILMPIF